MEKYFDCSQIQPYRCNKNLVVSLHPLPSNGSIQTPEEICCKTCKRRLMDPYLFSFCCISCKVISFGGDQMAVNGIANNNVEVINPVANIEEPPVPVPVPGAIIEATNRRQRNRKGKPVRAPFY
ncbi:uncharacterized protein [Rutidosis leptorrhynchoides]|uniref:uncharacterized protein n=1 Tax=Rutidosis leptorrhynchoides TaxID=125765 RepID=UPI003A9A4DCA